MTKRELLEELEEYPDDMVIMDESMNEITRVETFTQYNLEEEVIILGV